MKKIAIVIWFIVVLVGCKSYSVLNYDVLKPAKNTIPPEVKSIVLVDNSYPFVDSSIHFLEVDGEIEILDSIWVEAFADSVLLSLKESLLSQNFFDTVFIDTTNYNELLLGKPLKKLTAFEVNTICAEFGADAVLALDGYKYGSKLEIVDYGDSQGASLDVNATCYWRFYDYYSQTILFEDLQQDTIYWYEEGSSAVHAASKLPSIKNAISEIGFYIGDAYVNHLVPTWETREQRLFIAGNSYFVNAAEWYGKSNYKEAEKLWAYVFEHGKNFEKARAAHNIAISFEQQNEIASALKWAFNSYNIYREIKSPIYAEEVAESKDYYIYLAHRKSEVEKLDQQIGGGL
ncbi:DUF6340 family protein [Carboxylicivirga sp. N1Y90]|uniref:DUF6340 family protein n=1 Tax=Carboxylicivirga fragile TaxID=3417571 RepID=UPI003D347420|nr:hypothetical protein [Marinilabiliaceae bacterium N1Y90]